MHGRKPVSTGALAATLAVAAVLGGCRDNASTGPSHVQSKDFASALRAVHGDQQIGSVGTALAESLQVKVLDANGLPVQGATVTFTVRAGGGSIIPPANVSSSTGFVSAVWILGTTLGANKAVAILANGFVLDSAVFNATATPGAPALLTKVSGDSQTTRVAHNLAAPLIVKLTDQYGFVRSGVHVTWTPGLFSGSLAPLADTTGADGTAQARWTLGTQAIPQSASASVTGTTPVVFTATATADTVRVIVPVQGNAQTGSVGQALPVTLKIKVTDQFGNAIAGEAVTWTDSIGGGSVSVAGGNTAADGTAQTVFTLGNRVGSQVVVAKHSLSGTTVNFTATGTVQFSTISAGNFHVCALSTFAKIYCWGLNDVGQLGKGTNLNTAAPTTAVALSADSSALANALTGRQLTGNRSSTCVLTVNQVIYCWGRRWSSLATSNLPLTFDFTANAGAGGPIAINYVQVSEDHACLVELSGLGNCTGVNDFGQLGNGLTTSPNANIWPYVNFPALWSVLATGSSFTCGMPRLNPATVASTLLSRTPNCWGQGGDGEMGNRANPPLTTNTVVSPIYTAHIAGFTGFDSLSLAAGDKHACAVGVADSSAYCWGNNAFGQLGKGVPFTNASRDSVAQKVVPPVAVNFARLYAGKYHTCGLTAAGAAWCWGRNDYGQLGNGSLSAFGGGLSTPVQVGPSATGAVMFRSLSLGELFTCGVAGNIGDAVGDSPAAGTVYCWGDDIFGQVGNGKASGGNAPVLVPTKVLYQP